MNDVFASECSSGCESGWTLYLDHTFLSPYPSRGNEFVDGKGGFTENRGKYEKEEEEEEDLSMVSDASSGPPHFHEDEDYNNGCFYHAPIDATLPKNTGVKRQKIKEQRFCKVQEQLSFLDDTASSPIFNFSNNNLTLTNNKASLENMLDFSQGHSATHFQGKSAFQEHFGFLQSSASGTQMQQNQWFEGKRVGMR